jgi:peptidoglycan/LPS O-acetylase OafA/YrhL
MATGRDNNAGALRLALAVAVIISHAWPLALGPGTEEPLELLTGRSLGGWAVLGFFVLSGLFIAQSADRRDMLTFWTARARRILPGLSVALIVTVILAILSGAQPDLETGLEYILRGVTLVSLEDRIPGAFAANPYPEVVNGPLWSLFHEVLAYGLCFVLARSGIMRHTFGMVMVLAGAVVLVIVAQVLPARAATFAPLFLAFALGMAGWRFRDRITLSWLVLVPLLPLAGLGWAFALIPFTYGLILLTWRLPVLALKTDLSFGLYIYGWPVSQLVLHLIPCLSPPELVLYGLLATLPFATASWMIIEQPALGLRRASV